MPNVVLDNQALQYVRTRVPAMQLDGAPVLAIVKQILADLGANKSRVQWLSQQRRAKLVSSVCRSLRPSEVHSFQSDAQEILFLDLQWAEAANARIGVLREVALRHDADMIERMLFWFFRRKGPVRPPPHASVTLLMYVDDDPKPKTHHVFGMSVRIHPGG